MPSHSETQHFIYSADQLYQLVKDVEKYPEFLPWCRAARITEQHDGYFIADLVICFKHITEKYTSKVILTPPQKAGGPAAIDVELVKGPFTQLENHWRFTPKSDGTELTFDVSFNFKSRILDNLIGPFFGKATEKMVSAFTTRAHELYGK